MPKISKLGKIRKLETYVKKGGLATIEALVTPLILILLSPWLLNKIGIEAFGQWTLALAMSGFTHIVSLGSSVATMHSIAELDTKEKDVNFTDIINAGLIITATTSIIAILVALCIAEEVASNYLSKIGEARLVETLLVQGIVALAIQEIDSLYAGVLRGIQRYDLIAKLEITSRPMWALMIVTCTELTGNVIYILYTHNLYLTIRLLIRILIVKKTLRSYKFSHTPSAENIKKIFNYGKWISTQSIGGFLFSTMDKIMIGWYYGAADLGRYSICIQIVQFAHNIQASFFQIITPIIARQHKDSNRKINYFKISLQTGALSSVMPIILLILSSHILTIWINEEFSRKNDELLSVLLTAGATLAFTVPAHFIILGLGMAKQSAIVLLTAGIISMILSLVLMPFGLTYFAYGRFAYAFVCCAYLISLFNLSEKNTR